MTPARHEGIAALRAELARGPGVLFLTNPAPPTGNRHGDADIEALVAAALTHRWTPVVDEAYAEFCSHPSASALLSGHDNLVVLRTLSKAYGLAGARCGALIADPEVIGLVEKVMPPYAVPTPSVECALAALAEHGDDAAYDLPRPMLNKPNFDFSFSGLKTAVMLEVRKATAEGRLDECRADLAASFQRAAVDTLIAKSIRAAQAEGLERIVVAGGVGANKLLRKEIAERFEGEVYYPRMAFCTDNGAMIAVAGALRLVEAGKAGEIRAQARWSLETLGVPARH